MEPDCKVRTLVSIGKDIRNWCNQNNIKRSELMEALEVSESTIYRICSGAHTLSSEQISRLAYLMNKPYEFFIPTDQNISENIYLQNLKKRSMSTSERMQRRIRQKCTANDEAERRLSAAVEIIQNVKDAKQKDRLIRHVESMLELAGCK